MQLCYSEQRPVMSTEIQQPVQENTAGPATGSGNDGIPTSTAPPTTETPILGSTDGKPSEKDTAEAQPNLTNKPKEEDLGNGEVLVESQAINEGVLNLKGPGLKGLIPNKKYFWLTDSPLDQNNLSAYISNEKSKDIAHSNAAHATQTGKGLLFYAKRAEDKDHPQGILNLADMTDLAKGLATDFTMSLHGSKYTFQATNKSERDGWLVALEPKMADAKASRDGIVSSSGYKSQLEKFGKPAAATDKKSKVRSLSRPNKDKASKSQERSAATTSRKDSTKDAVKTEATTDSGPAAATTGTPATTPNPANPDAITAANPATTTSDSQTGTKGEIGAAAATGAAAGGAVAGAPSRKDSTSDEERKNKKSRSQSRGNKRSSIFGGLLGKKEEHDDKKAVKKAEREEKKEEKKEDKAIASEVKKEDKAEHRAEKAAENEVTPGETGKTGDFDAAAVAARVVDAPVISETGATTETSPVAATENPTLPATTATTTPATKDATTPATKETAVKPNKRASMFGGLFGKKDSSASPAATEASLVVPPKDETAPVSSTAPQLDNPVTEPTSETIAPSTDAAKVEPTPASEVVSPTTGPTSATTPTDKRRTSFFGGLGTKKERKGGATSGDELTDNETRKQSGGFGGLLRKASRAQPKRDSKAPAASPAEAPLAKEGATGDKAVVDGEQPVTNGETPAVAGDQKVEAKPDLAEGGVGANAVVKPEETPAVKATV